MFHIILGAEFHAVDIKVALQASEWVSKGGEDTVEQVDGHNVLVTGSNLHKSKQVNIDKDLRKNESYRCPTTLVIMF